MPDKVEKRHGWYRRAINKVGLSHSIATEEAEAQISSLNKALGELKDEFQYAQDTWDRDFWKPDRKPPTEEEYIKATHHSPWFYAAVFMLSNTVAQLPWQFTLEAEDPDTGEIGDVPLDEDTAIVPLFHNPDPVNKTTWYSLIEGTCQYLECAGNAYWLIFHDKAYVVDEEKKTVRAKTRKEQQQNPKGGVFRIRLLRPDKVKPIRDKKTKALRGWAYKPGRGKATPYDIDDVVHFDYFNPADDFQGLSPATPAWDSIEALVNFDRLNRRLIEHNFEIGLVVEADKDAVISVGQGKALANKLKQRHSGVNKTGEPFWGGPGVKIRSMFEPKDLQFEQLQTVMIRNVCAATGVPAALLGMTDQYNRANMKAIRKSFYKDTIMPKTRRIAEKINAQIIPLLEPTLTEKGLKFSFNFAGVEALKEDPKDAAVATKHAVGRAWMTANEARAQQGMPVRQDDPTADELYTKPALGFPAQAQEAEEEAEKTGYNDLEWFEPLDHIDWKRAAADPVGFRIWKRTRQAIAPIETKMIAEIHQKGKAEYDAVMEELHKQWHQLEERGVVEKRGVYKSMLCKGPIMPEAEFTALYYELAKHLDGEGEWLLEAVMPEIDVAIEAGANLAAGTLEAGFEFDLLNPNIEMYKRSMGERIVAEIPGTTMTRFRDSMYKGYEAGEGIVELSQRVTDQLGALTGKHDWRAELIARTETNSAFNFGSMESYKQAKVDGTKHWISAFDDRVREWHIAVEAVKGRQTPFTVFGPSGAVSMMYPGDMAGGAENACNCRCCVSLSPE